MEWSAQTPAWAELNSFYLYDLYPIIMDICKAPTLWPKALNKYNMTHNVHRNGKCYQQLNKKLAHNVDNDKGSSITMWKMCAHTHTHTRKTHTIHTDRGEGQSCLLIRSIIKYVPVREKYSPSQEVMDRLASDFLHSLYQGVIKFAAAKPNWKKRRLNGCISKTRNEEVQQDQFPSIIFNCRRVEL